ncbi:MAG: mannose-1-phosphate guanylyltransferase/mannose-6-phosphate isomerase [Proteobacteria bacterium]|nr:mannose-1-phosphate guanylyltransferase/mannose-6-phosphate isomerase [Pseudomonadota bacterium]
MINVILCGGAGTRLWPISRTKLPKQFVRLFDGRSLFQKTVQRNLAFCSDLMVVSGASIYFLAQDQLMQEGGTGRFLLEPMGRNTAPAIALASMLVDPDDIVLVTTSDHLIQNTEAFEKAVRTAKGFAEADFIATFGIKPTYPETGFGYIEAQGNDVLSFREKPVLELAQKYLEQGNYYWNSGMFCFKASVLLSELQEHAPEIYAACSRAVDLMTDEDRSGELVRIDEQAMAAIPSNSIDYAVMEHSKKVKVVPCDIGWSDLGSFDSLYTELVLEQADEHKNTFLHGGAEQSRPIFVSSQRNLVVTEKRQVALVDVDDLLVVDTADALLISKSGSSQQVKEVVARLKSKDSGLTEIHTLAYRPWGSYEVLLDEDTYKAKRIIVKPNQKLSLQKHRHRAELWIVVEGSAIVTNADKVFEMNKNETTFIEKGAVHRLENRGDEDLVLIEVQVGDYTGEDDIIRLEDIYGRT